MAKLQDILIENYMPYAKGTIISRAIPGIDGLKPVNRRILYTMHKMNLYRNRAKSANIVGATTVLHPHGDSAIYDAMARMTSGHEALNVPYIDSQGYFGKTYSRDTEAAAPRYTEAKLSPICKELFEGINEGAVKFKDNYDKTEQEPEVLPVKFPSVLVNTSSGIAVGTSSNIPQFGLKEVCESTIGILKGEIDTVEKLMKVLGAPDFTTGGHIHCSDADLLKLGKTGRGSFTISGTVVTSRGRIRITEIPYRTTVEAIIDDLKEAVKNGTITEISDVRDESDIKGLKVVIELKRGSDVRFVLRKINRLTRLRLRMSFITRVILEKEEGKPQCVTLGLLELLEEWIEFRVKTIRKIFEHRRDKKEAQEEMLSAWEKIGEDLSKIVEYVSSNSERVSLDFLMANYKMTWEQANYIMDMRIKELTTDRMRKKLEELYQIRKDIQDYNEVIEDDAIKKRMIVEDLEYVIDKYGDTRMTNIVEPLPKGHDDIKEEEHIEDVDVIVIITNRGYIKRLVTLRDASELVLQEDDQIRFQYNINNKDELLLFTYSGMCYKVPVHTIDASRGVPRDFVFNMVEKLDDSELLYAVPAGDYSGSFNVVFDSGRGTKVRLGRVSGNRKRYRNVFEGGEPGDTWCTPDDRFFIVTRRRSAAYIDLEFMAKLSNRTAFRVARIAGNDSIFGVQSLNDVPDKDKIDLERYTKGYCVKINDDKLWE